MIVNKYFHLPELSEFMMRVVSKVRALFSPNKWGAKNAPVRIIVFANGLNPIIQFSLLIPLRQLISEKKVFLKLIREEELRRLDTKGIKIPDALLSKYNATHFIFSRYGGPLAKELLLYSRRNQIKIIFQIDDDLLNVPRELGQHKFEFHNSPARKRTILHLLENSDKILVSTSALAEKLKTYCPIKNLVVMDPFIPAFQNHPPPKNANIRIGYMGFDHQKDLELIAPALANILKEYPQVTLHFLGRIKTPEVLRAFTDRIEEYEPIFDYEKYLEKVASLRWDIGVCPLTDSDFNRYKANTKWVEYSSLGIAVIASKGFIYDEFEKKNAVLLADTVDDWYRYMNLLINNHSLRETLVENAQKNLSSNYTLERFATFIQQVLND